MAIKYTFWKAAVCEKGRVIQDRYNNNAPKVINNEKYAPAGQPATWKEAQVMIEKAIFNAKPGDRFKLNFTISAEDVVSQVDESAALKSEIAELKALVAKLAK